MEQPPPQTPRLPPVHPGWALITFGWSFQLQSCWLKRRLSWTEAAHVWRFSSLTHRPLFAKVFVMQSRCTSQSERGVIHFCLFFFCIRISAPLIQLYFHTFYYSLIVGRPLRLLHSSSFPLTEAYTVWVTLREWYIVTSGVYLEVLCLLPELWNVLLLWGVK